MTQHCTQDERLLDYLYEEMSAQDAETFSAHVEGCAHCRTELQQLRGVRTAFHDLPAPEPRPEALQRMTAQLLHQAAQSRRGGSGHEQQDEAGGDPEGAAGGGLLGKLLPFRRRPLMKMLLHPASGLLVAAAATLTLVVVSRDWQKNLAPIHQPMATAPTQPTHEAPVAAPAAPAQTVAPEVTAEPDTAKKDETASGGSAGGLGSSDRKQPARASKGEAPAFDVLDVTKTSSRWRASAAKAKAAPTKEDRDALLEGDGAPPAKPMAGPARAPAPVYANKSPSPKLEQAQPARESAKVPGGLIQQAPPPPPGAPSPTDTQASDKRYAQPPPEEPAEQQAPPAVIAQQMAKEQKAAAPAKPGYSERSAANGEQAALAPLQAQAAPTQMPSQAPAATSVPRSYAANADSNNNGPKGGQQAPQGSLSGAGRGKAQRGYYDDAQDGEELKQQTRNLQRTALNRAVSQPAMPAALAQNDMGPLRDQFYKYLKLGQCQQAQETLRKLENRFPSSPDDAAHVGQYQKVCGARPGTDIAQPQAAPMRRQAQDQIHEKMARPAKKAHLDKAASDELNEAPSAAPEQNQNQNQSPATNNVKK